MKKKRPKKNARVTMETLSMRVMIRVAILFFVKEFLYDRLVSRRATEYA